MKGLNGFMHLYFFQIESILNKQNNDLAKIKFQSEEANTDEYLKQFFKSFLLKHNHIQDTYYLDVKIENGQEIEIYNKSDLKQIYVKDVLLPIELTSKHRNIIQEQKKSVYTNPDLYIKLTNGIKDKYISVELKSTKNDKIPGSSIQQISPHEWVIFVQHKNDIIKVATGMYINSITEKLTFPDRSPRPEIGFNTLYKWNLNNRIISNSTLQCLYTNNKIKEQILENWNLHLVEEWLSTVKKSTKTQSEKWFNHTIRLYSLSLIEYYDSIDNEQKEVLKHTLQKLTSED